MSPLLINQPGINILGVTENKALYLGVYLNLDWRSWSSFMPGKRYIYNLQITDHPQLLRYCRRGKTVN
ncbi:hypothetical protein XENTR_v10011930 [Xenopus tropicalis]|nr:hypothetical protein XENTR_v10011930 [Xenopus tropicalis]